MSSAGFHHPLRRLEVSSPPDTPVPPPYSRPRTTTLQSSGPEQLGEMSDITAESSPSLSRSPSPSIRPISAVPGSTQFRSFSANSSLSSQSSHSSPPAPGSRSSSFSSASTRRRGYIRPQGITFAESAKNRESVMSLGSISHLQYYFARTGLLDGKGGRLAKRTQSGEYDIPKLSLHGSDSAESPIEEEGELLWEAAKEEGPDIMLPPTFSTYSPRMPYVPPPPDHKSLKKDLVDALENALRSLEESVPAQRAVEVQLEEKIPTQGFYEIEGLHILDTTTLAIRAARIYYTMHPFPARLTKIKPDFKIRRELMEVLDVLKRWAGRNFAGGLRQGERMAILAWVCEVGVMLDTEAKLEEAESLERERWEWMDDTLWGSREKEREVCFLSSLLADLDDVTLRSLPQWKPPTQDHGQTNFLTALADGRRLVEMHNVAVRRSKKHFGRIEKHHFDVSKPYRRAENLRFWIKAAEIRWEIKLNFNVMGIVQTSQDMSIWSGFEDAVTQWSKGVREEVTRDWNGDAELSPSTGTRNLAL